MSELLKKLEGILKDFKGKVTYQEPLKKYTSLKTGGLADVVVFPADRNDLILLFKKIGTEKIPFFILGAGSNLIVRDGGIRGIVIKLSHLNGIERQEQDLVFAESGVLLPRLIKYALDESLSGFEFLSSIPGSVGGALKMNAGVPGCEISGLVEFIQILNLKGKMITMRRKEAHFGYRSSRFPNGIILGGGFRLEPASKHEIQERLAQFLKRRRETQPLSYPNVGSIFKNPPGGFAGQLIEEVGLKGIQIGGAQISEKHANFIINKGSATSKDILQLIRLAGKTVEERKGIALELEARIVGTDAAHT
ncbi:MAG: UDP-N-acetylmuramate dehydrogenase [Nitrospirae bacterium]|nr:UDP-N-acetylmuramate dehydrogenase [Nitrospirota bacterium]MBI3593847.1 UDP-N-acetylmuramate dehydrogenase [Nitrospirota bacterium]